MAFLSVKEKAVEINMRSGFFGSIAEIGGGQETVRHLFQAGGASNSVAKSISAYDKRFSDHFYNKDKSERYVSQSRLQKMVACEFFELRDLLSEEHRQKRFFSFANTLEILNYHKTNSGHGWVGIMAESDDAENPDQVIVHLKFLENDSLLQQYTAGTFGINLIYAMLFYRNDPRKMLASLIENLDANRVEVDYITFSGPSFSKVDNRLMNLMLVANEMTPAIMFDKNGNVVQPSELLFKKNVLAFRGFFRPINNLGMDIIAQSTALFQKDEDYEPDNTIVFCEINLKYLMNGKEVDESDFLARVDLLNIMGQYVMVSNYQRFFKLVDYFGQFKMNKLRIVMGLPTFLKVLDKDFYTDMRGGMLESLGKLFATKTKVYLYPSLAVDNKVIDVHNVPVAADIAKLIDYLLLNRKIIMLSDANSNYLNITNEHVADMIAHGDTNLSDVVPVSVALQIVDKKLFGYGSMR